MNRNWMLLVVLAAWAVFAPLSANAQGDPTTLSLYPPSWPGPPSVQENNDVGGGSRGLRFQSSLPALVTAIRYYAKGAITAGTITNVTVTLYNSDGTALGSGAIATVRAGWNVGPLSSPVSIAAGQKLVASIELPANVGRALPFSGETGMSFGVLSLWRPAPGGVPDGVGDSRGSPWTFGYSGALPNFNQYPELNTLLDVLVSDVVSVPRPSVSYSFNSSFMEERSGSLLQYVSTNGSGPVVPSQVSFVADRCGRKNMSVSFAPGHNTYLGTNGVLPALPVGSAARTFTAWMTCASWISSSNSHRYILSYGVTSGNGRNSMFELNHPFAPGKLFFDGWIVYSVSNDDLPCANALSSSWLQVAVTIDAQGNSQFYVNGTAVATRNVPAGPLPLNTDATPLIIGSTWVGALDDLRIYNQALNQIQMRAVFTAEADCSSESTTCSAGSYRNGSACLSCPPGSFSNRAGSTACSVCPAGSFSSSAGASSCGLCSAGRYSSPGSPSCSVCAAGTFSGNGSASCTRCPVGQVAPAGSSQCSACPEGTAADSTQASCSVCAAGSAVTVQVSGAQYTGPDAAALGSVISVSATVPYMGPAPSDPSDEVQASVTFDGPGVVPCTATAELKGAEFTARCFAAIPARGITGTFPLSATFVYQKDWCVQYVGSVSSPLTLVDVGRVATVADAAAAGVAAEVIRASAAEAALRTDLTTEATARSQSDAFLTTAVRNETARAVSAEGALAFNLSLVSSRVGALEVAEPSFLFRGLQSGIEVSYPNGQQPGAGIASMLNYPLRFDAPLSARGSAIRYNSTTGVVSLVQPGSYRLDAFIHLYSTQGASVVGTGVVAWMSVGAAGAGAGAGAAGGAPPQPIGPNLLNPNAMGVPQGTVGDNTFVSTLLTVPEGTSPTAPFHAQCVLVSMNQRKNQITDASVISVTKLK